VVLAVQAAVTLVQRVVVLVRLDKATVVALV
jgi:hypothetical protein